jgi:hypothetical protein
MRQEAAAEGRDFGDSAEWVDLNVCLDKVVEQEEALLEAHMASIQENAEMLTEEGQLLARVQGRDVLDYDIDGYTARLEHILQRRAAGTRDLLAKLTEYRRLLRMEEKMSRRVDARAEGRA